MYENLSTTNINFYNYILSKQNALNSQTNFSNSNFTLFKNSKSLNSSEIQNYKNLHQSNKAIKNIKVNKLNSNDISLKSINNIYFQTNEDFYHSKPLNKRNKSSNYFIDDYNTINYNNINNALLPYNRHKRTKSNFIFMNNNFISNTNNDDNIYGKINNIRDNIIKDLIDTDNKNNKKNTELSEEIYNFKNMKMFYAHLELLLSLYLKRYFKFFIQRIKQYEKIKNVVNVNLYNSSNNNNNQPIINLNNAHCSLYCSININKDNNGIFGQNNNNINKSQNLKIGNKNKNHFCSTKDIKNKNIYIPKNKSKNLKENKSKVFINKDKAKINNKNNDIKKSSPIKEMNIDLKKMNINQNKIKNQRTVNSKNEKYKLKISNTKNDIYKRPKDSNNISKNMIKEIKIRNKEFILTPYENKNKKFFDTIYSMQQSTINKENNNIKKIYIRKNNNNEIDNIKAALFRNKSNISFFKSFSDYIQNKPKKMLIKKIITADKRIYININYVNLDSFFGNSNISVNKINSLLGAEHTLSLTIIKNTLLLPDNINQNIIFSEIFTFDNDKKLNQDYNKIIETYFNEMQKRKEKTCKIKIDIFKLSKTIKDIIVNNIRKYLLKKFKKDIYLRKLIAIKKNKILSYYFKYFLLNKTNNLIKSGIYHKINYNDDFNLNKKVKSPTNTKNNNNFRFKVNEFSLNSKNNSILYKNKNKKNKNQTQLSTNYSHNYKYWNKEFNITVHENKINNNNNINKKKNITSYNNKNKK